MQIGRDYKIVADSMNIILLRKYMATRKKTNEKYEAWRTEGYFSSICNALKFLIQQHVRESGLKDLKTIQAEISRLEKILEHPPQALRDTTRGHERLRQ